MESENEGKGFEPLPVALLSLLLHFLCMSLVAFCRSQLDGKNRFWRVGFWQVDGECDGRGQNREIGWLSW